MLIEEWLDTNDQMCKDIVCRKYLIEKELLKRGYPETVDELLDRVSGGNEAARELMVKRRFLPGGRIIANRGLSKYGQKCTYSNCYVNDPPEDSIESIYKTCAELARTFSYGGGCGIDISKLAPEGAVVNNTARYSSGAISFVNTFSEVAETIGIRGRRAALMISMDIRHPDIEKFITHKSDLELTQGANMSVRVDDAFFNAVKNDEYIELSFQRPETNYNISKSVKAKDILHLLAETNWDYAEPGMLYWDMINNWNLMSDHENFKYAGTNPCGEEPLQAGGACLLGAMNLSEYVGDVGFDFDQFEKDVEIAVGYLNEVLEEGASLHPLKVQRDSANDWKAIGLGVMGLADLFVKMKFPYGSEESVDLTNRIGYSMIWAAVSKSNKLAKRIGMFKYCDPEKIIYSDFFRSNISSNPNHNSEEIGDLIESIRKYGLRNCQLLTCAPTGTISTILNISGGIEPMFALEFTRTTKSLYGVDKTYTVHPKAVSVVLKKYGKSSISELDNIPDYLVTSRDIGYKERINVQAALQDHIDAAISATINLPESTTVEDIENLYMYAYEKGLKGATVYRENCKRTAILNDTYKKDKEKSEHEDDKNKIKNTKNSGAVEVDRDGASDVALNTKSNIQTQSRVKTRLELGDCMPGHTYYRKTGCGHLYITVNNDRDGKPVEVFVQSSKSGGCSANTEAIGRLTSSMLRSGMNVDDVIDSILGVKCSACSALKGKGESIDGLSCSDIVARTIRAEYNNNKQSISSKPPVTTAYHGDGKLTDYNKDQVCPECGHHSLKYSEGCIKCLNCGYSKC